MPTNKHRRKHFRPILVLIATLLVLPSLASASPALTPADEEAAARNEQYRQGRTALDESRWSDAVRAFDRDDGRIEYLDKFSVRPRVSAFFERQIHLVDPDLRDFHFLAPGRRCPAVPSYSRCSLRNVSRSSSAALICSRSNLHAILISPCLEYSIKFR